MTAVTAYLVFLAVTFGALAALSRQDKKKRDFQELALRTKNTRQTTSISIAYLSFAVHAGVFILGAGLGYPLATNIIVSIIAPAFALMIRRYMETRGRTKLKRQMEPVLSSLGCALYGNPSLSNAIAEVATRTEDPMRQQLLLIGAEIAHGRGVDDALQAAARRIDDKIFTFAVDAIVVCRATGADISAVLDRVAKLAGSRILSSEKVMALAAQQKTTAKFVTLIPICFLFAVYSLNPLYAGYLRTSVGMAALVYAAISVGTGFYVLSRMTSMAPDGGRR